MAKSPTEPVIVKRGPKPKKPKDKKKPLPVSASVKNHKSILAKILPIIKEMDQ